MGSITLEKDYNLLIPDNRDKLENDSSTLRRAKSSYDITFVNLGIDIELHVYTKPGSAVHNLATSLGFIEVVTP